MNHVKKFGQFKNLPFAVSNKHKDYIFVSTENDLDQRIVTDSIVVKPIDLFIGVSGDISDASVKISIVDNKLKFEIINNELYNSTEVSQAEYELNKISIDELLGFKMHCEEHNKEFLLKIDLSKGF